MKRAPVVVTFLIIAAALAHGQNAPYRVVFDLTSRDSLDQKAVMRWVKEISESHPEAELEVVMYGKGFELVMPERSTVLPDVQNAMKNPNVSFKVCRFAMKSNKITESQLEHGAQTVPDGVYEIISKQHDGWGYIKVGH